MVIIRFCYRYTVTSHALFLAAKHVEVDCTTTLDALPTSQVVCTEQSPPPEPKSTLLQQNTAVWCRLTVDQTFSVNRGGLCCRDTGNTVVKYERTEGGRLGRWLVAYGGKFQHLLKRSL